MEQGWFWGPAEGQREFGFAASSQKTGDGDEARESLSFVVTAADVKSFRRALLLPALFATQKQLSSRKIKSLH